MGFPHGSVVNNLLASAGDLGDAGSISGSGRSPGGRDGNPLQYSRLENEPGGLQSMESQESDMAERLRVQPVLRSICVHVFFIRLSVSGYLGCFGVHIYF